MPQLMVVYLFAGNEIIMESLRSLGQRHIQYGNRSSALSGKVNNKTIWSHYFKDFKSNNVAIHLIKKTLQEILNSNANKTASEQQNQQFWKQE